MSPSRADDDAILDAARLLLTEAGPRALTLRRIANAAGCSTMPIYSHFGGKAGIIDTLWRNGFVDLRGRIATRTAGGSPPERVVGTTLALRDLAIDDPHLYQLMLTRAIDDFEPSQMSIDLMCELYDDLCEALRACAADIDADRVAHLLVGAAHGMILFEIEERVTAPDPADRYQALMEAVLAAETARVD